MKPANRNALIALISAILLLALFMVMPAIQWPASASKWRQDMPEDGTMLCSASGQGFQVTNNPWGFHVDRNPTFDKNCGERMK